MKHWIDEESESDNVIVVNDSTIFIGSCDKEAYKKVDEQLTEQTSPIEVLGTDDLVAIPLNQLQGLTSRSTDTDVDIRYQAKKDIEDKSLNFENLEKKQDFMAFVNQVVPSHLEKSEAQQSVVSAAISPVFSLILSLASIYLFMDKFRWLSIIVGGIWALISISMLVSRIKEPPMVTRWAVKGRHIRKLWNGIKTFFSYLMLAAFILAMYVKFPDSYGPKSLIQQMENDSLAVEDVATLLERGADINLKSRDGYTTLAYALMWDQNNLAIALIEAGADLTLDIDDLKPLEYVIYNDSSLKVIEAMLKKGASQAFTMDELSPQEYAKQNEKPALAKLLTKYQ